MSSDRRLDADSGLEKAPATVLGTLREAPLAVRTVLAGVLVNRLSGFLNIFLVLFLTAEGHSPGDAVTALGFYGAGAVLGSLVGGTAVDRLGVRAATVVSMAGTAFLTASLLHLPGLPLLLAAVALAGLSAQLFRPASATLLSELTPPDRHVMIFAMYRFGLNVGATAAPLVGYGLYHAGGQGYVLLFWGEALIALLYAAAAWATLPARAGRTDRGGRTPDGGEGPGRGSYAAVLRDRRFLLYLVAAFCHAAVYVQYTSTLPLYMQDVGMAMFWYTFAVALNGFVVVAFELLVTKYAQTWPLKVTIGLGFAVVGAGVALYGLPIGPAAVVIGTLVWSLGEIIGGPSVFAYPAGAGPAHLRSRYIGGFHFMFGLGTALGPVIGGWLLLRLDGGSLWPVVALGSLAATVCGLAAVRRPAVARETVKETAQAPAAVG
ncbi:MFS transporter [Streptomyces fragilis]|uniref:MFS transporter n=1 Tax=Streptomyces fragilis TaxID=67301 RepID=A0ABV2YAT5_9ACTN|nr:MFS transporter [Streptomyces fragilis]